MDEAELATTLDWWHSAPNIKRNGRMDHEGFGFSNTESALLDLSSKYAGLPRLLVGMFCEVAMKRGPDRLPVFLR